MIIIIIIIIIVIINQNNNSRDLFSSSIIRFYRAKENEIKKKQTNEKKIDQWQRAGLAHRNTD